MSTKELKDTRSVVLLEDIKGLGKSGDVVRVAPARAEALVKIVKARGARVEDFGLPKR